MSCVFPRLILAHGRFLFDQPQPRSIFSSWRASDLATFRAPCGTICAGMKVGPSRLQNQHRVGSSAVERTVAVRRRSLRTGEHRLLVHATANLLRGQLPAGSAHATDLGQSLLACLHDITRALGDPGAPEARALLGRLARSSKRVLPAGTGNDIPWIGDLQNELAHTLRLSAPELLREAVAVLPELKQEMKALEATADFLLERFGPLLSRFNVAVTSHILAEAPGFAAVLERLGASPQDTEWMGVPYSSNEIGVEGLRQRGHRASIPHGREGRLEQRWGPTVDANVAFRYRKHLPSIDTIRAQHYRELLLRLIERSRANGKPILIIDDGGYAAECIQRFFPHEADRFALVEQTARGAGKIRAIGGFDNVCINVAEDPSKKIIESPFVADAVCEATLIALGASADTGALRGKKAASVGVGDVGLAVARTLRAKGLGVTAFDADVNRLRGLSEHGLVAGASMRDALADADFLIGATGTTSLSSEAFLQLKPGAKIISVSSTDVEHRDSWSWGEALGAALEVAVPLANSASPSAVPKSPNLDLDIRPNLPGSRHDGQRLSLQELESFGPTRAFGNALSARLADYGGRVCVRAKISFVHPTEILGAALGPHAVPLRAFAHATKVEAAESLLFNRTRREPVWLVNGGFPVNLSRRLISMPARRIQVTLAGLASGAMQAAWKHLDGQRPGLTKLDSQLSNRVIDDFCRHAASEVSAPVRAQLRALREEF